MNYADEHLADGKSTVAACQLDYVGNVRHLKKFGASADELGGGIHMESVPRVRTARTPAPKHVPWAGCPYCGANPQPLHDEVPVPVCCLKAQLKMIYGGDEEEPE